MRGSDDIDNKVMFHISGFMPQPKNTWAINSYQDARVFSDGNFLTDRPGNVQKEVAAASAVTAVTRLASSHPMELDGSLHGSSDHDHPQFVNEWNGFPRQGSSETREHHSPVLNSTFLQTSS